MDLGLKGKVALVAAASRGLGKAVAQALASEGVDVAIAARTRAALVATAEEIAGLGHGRCLPIVADVSVPADLERLADAVLTEWGRIDILVNNAGGPRPGSFDDMTDADWMGALELNLMSAVRLTRLALPSMRAHGWGRVINLTSVAVKQPLPNLILSNAARSAVVAMAKTLSSEVAGEGITVNNICPGYVLTDRVRSLAAATAKREGLDPAQVLVTWEERIPAGRLGRPEELGALVAYLASQQAAYVTGVTLQMDGGLTQGLL